MIYKKYKMAPYRIMIAVCEIAICGLFVLGCDGYNTLRRNTSDVTVETLPDGYIIAPLEKVSMRLVYRDRYRETQLLPNNITVLIYDQDNQLVFSQDVAIEDGDESLPFMEVPDIPNGLYTIHLNVWQQKELLGTTISNFFITTEEYHVNGITSYSSVIEPNSDGLLLADIDAPSDSDPYLVWYLDDVLIAQGNRTDGIEKVHIKTPMNKGTYRIRLELFPHAFPDGAEYRSSAFYRTTIVVSEAVPHKSTDFLPDDSYFSMLHLQGNLKDHAMAHLVESDSYLSVTEEPQYYAATTNQDLELDIQGSIFGYKFDGQSQVEWDSVIFPYKNDELVPFIITTRLLLHESSKDMILFHAGSDDGQLQFLYSITPAQALVIEMDYNGVESVARTQDGVVPLDAPIYIDAIVIPAESEPIIFWYINTKLVQGDSINLVETLKENGLLSDADTNPDVPSDTDPDFNDEVNEAEDDESDVPFRRGLGWSALGDEEHGFVGIIDEFGIYFRDSIESDTIDFDLLFAHGVHAQINEILYSWKFDPLNPTISDEITISDGVVLHKTGLQLGPEGTIWLPFVTDFDHNRITIELKTQGALQNLNLLASIRYAEESILKLFELQHETIKVSAADRDNQQMSLTDPLDEEIELIVYREENSYVAQMGAQKFRTPPLFIFDQSDEQNEEENRDVFDPLELVFEVRNGSAPIAEENLADILEVTQIHLTRTNL